MCHDGPRVGNRRQGGLGNTLLILRARQNLASRRTVKEEAAMARSGLSFETRRLFVPLLRMRGGGLMHPSRFAHRLAAKNAFSIAAASLSRMPP
jgi:hypothetical protein